MPNHVGNSIIVRGPEDEISRLIATCFDGRPAQEDSDQGDREFDFHAVIPVDDSSIEALMRCPDPNALRREAWGTKWNAYDCAIVARRPGYLSFEFITANNVPEPVYRELGRQFPRLMFDIAVIDPGSWWAVTGRIIGEDATFDEDADCKEVFERVYKEPFENALQPDT